MDLEPPFRPLRLRDGYLPLEDLGLIGDGATAALVGLDGSIPWLCVPGFDAEPLFCGLLDRAGGGQFGVTPEGVVEARQYYQVDTGVLVTELRTATGLLRLTDTLALRSRADLTDDTPADRGELVRLAEVLDGTLRLRVDVQPRDGGLLRFGLKPESVSLHLTGTTTRSNVLSPLTLTATPDPAELPPYGRLLLDVLNGDPTLSIRADEAEESWRVVTPVIEAWTKDLVPLEEYPAGSDGPAPLSH
jgi:hypothetical protein